MTKTKLGLRGLKRALPLKKPPKNIAGYIQFVMMAGYLLPSFTTKLIRIRVATKTFRKNHNQFSLKKLRD